MIPEWLHRGGPVVWPLLVLSFVSLAVAFERSLFWIRMRGGRGELLALARERGIATVEARIARGMSVLDTTITIAPMLGILGTVLGIIDSFELLSADSRPDPVAVSGGIAEALISTALGLVVALAAILPFNLFRSRIHTCLTGLEDAIGERRE